MDERFSVNNIVGSFLEFFRERGHEVVPGVPLLPEDPTLLFTSAGMVPFKSYFNDPANAPYRRAASVQKCLRAGGRQSDLENVGRTLRHHTFFEMLGNFSFGDYFKKEAIEWGWELSIDVWGLDKDRIWVSVFEDDDEAFELWEKHIGFPKKRIVRLGKDHNFWGPVGETGICGPSSEMHYDTGRPGKRGGPGKDDGDRYIEYWNLVFPQFDLNSKGVYDPLPSPGIDTGMGLERVACILQDAEDNFHTDEFLPIREAVARALPGPTEKGDAALAVNAAADHVRALTFALAEGIMPSNEGRGYVLRRLLRRALTKMHPFGVHEPFLAAAVDAVVDVAKVRYPELEARRSIVREMITAEEVRFLDTLEQGMERLEAVFDAKKTKKTKTVTGTDVFQLYDTFGFPPELTAELAEERGFKIDQAGFEAAMGEQKERGRSHSTFAHDTAKGTDGARVVATRTFKEIDSTEFIGYDELDCEAALAEVRWPAPPEPVGRRSAPDGFEFFDFITDQTVFYPEGGGQVGDSGQATLGKTGIDILDTYRVGDKIAHLGLRKVEKRDPDKKGPRARLSVDRVRRLATERNHTATHLLHAALRNVLGDHVAQAGSLVAPDRLRFDFHHFQAMKPEEVAEVERAVNDVVMADLAVTTEHMPYDEAVAAGAMALFGEKYGATVRVVTVEDFSRELCGGTHLRRTGEVGPFLIRHETAVGSGVRRVEALTGAGSLSYVKELLEERGRLAGLLKVGTEDVETRVRALLEQTDVLQKQQRRDAERRAKEQAGDALADAEEIKGVRYVAVTTDAADVGALRQYGDAMRGRLDLGVGLVCQSRADKPVCLVVVSDRAIKERSLRADDITRRIGEELGYRGGGKPHMAQVGIPNASEFNKLKEFVKASLESLL